MARRREFIGNTDDWLRIVFTHEFTHIVHLDRSEGWARVVRGVFGRVPLAFPNVFLPTWQIEGLATYEESVVTGDGRLHAGDFRAIVGEAARAGRLEPIDRVNGGLVDWPGGLAPYAYGLGFHQWLADRFGADRLAALADETAREIPYLSSRAFRRVFGEPLGRLWTDYEASAARQASPSNAAGTARRLTHHGFTVTGPRFAASCDGCPPSILYYRHHAARTAVALRSLARRLDPAADDEVPRIDDRSRTPTGLLRSAGGAPERRALRRPLFARPDDRRRAAA